MLLPPPLSPTSATVSPGSSSRSTDSSTGTSRPGYANETSLEPDRRVARARREAGAGGDRGRLLDQPEQPLGDGEPVGARVVLRGEVPQRQVELGREHEHRERGLEADVAVDEPHADGDRDQRDADRRGQLEHRAGEERDPQRPHRRAAVLVADLLDPLGLRLAAVEGAQRRQPAHDVEKCVASSASACQRSRVCFAVARPISHMKTGTSGSVSSMTPAESGSITATSTSTASGTTAARTTCGR